MTISEVIRRMPWSDGLIVSVPTRAARAALASRSNASTTRPALSHNRTLKTILTRSRERGQVFAGKALAALTYTTLVVFAMAAVGLIAASVKWGLGPLQSLSGTRVAAGHGLALLFASLALYVLPLAGIACFGLLLSTITRNVDGQGFKTQTLSVRVAGEEEISDARS